MQGGQGGKLLQPIQHFLAQHTRPGVIGTAMHNPVPDPNHIQVRMPFQKDRPKYGKGGGGIARSLAHGPYLHKVHQARRAQKQSRPLRKAFDQHVCQPQGRISRAEQGGLQGCRATIKG